MHAFDHRLPTATAMMPVLAVVAILGFVAGHDRSHAASGEKSRRILGGSVLLEYPSDWEPVASASGIPGLSIAHPVVLAPGGDAANAGLITGQLAGGEPSPLPERFMTRVRKPPDAEVVDLPETQAYRYARLSIQGFDQMLSIYAIPNPGGNPTILACYASVALSAYMRTCEQIVATLTLVGQQPSYDLAPEPGYARRLSASIGALDAQRDALRREMRQGASLFTVQRGAARLAAGFANAAASLSLLEPSLFATAQAQAALSRSILRARDAYTALAAAATAESPSRFAVARRQVYEAETSINAALESFALLGYRT
ncbi:MAG TPA: hypothetical protein VII53_00960 [Solirubrobacteraceae bacterium]